MYTISGKMFDEERALYALSDCKVENCSFEGPADGESAFKEAHHIEVENCTFKLRYPFWHTRNAELDRITMTDTCRAALWYCDGIRVQNSNLNGIKCLRESGNVTFENVNANSDEFGWRCHDLTFENCKINSVYLLFECKNISVRNFGMTGKYSFQYLENATIFDADLDTKDAFWHAKNVHIKNCTVKGEYLAWYSDGLTFENCHIIGTQPFCYCKDLTLINCTMDKTDLAFEYSEVRADVNGEILSVKNPCSGEIVADSFGEIIHDNPVYQNNCRITVRQK